MTMEEFIEEWENNCDVELFKKIIKILKSKKQNKEEELKILFQKEEKLCFENCWEDGVDDFWSSLKWIKEDVFKVLNNLQ